MLSLVFVTGIAYGPRAWLYGSEASTFCYPSFHLCIACTPLVDSTRIAIPISFYLRRIAITQSSVVIIEVDSCISLFL